MEEGVWVVWLAKEVVWAPMSEVLDGQVLVALVGGQWLGDTRELVV